MSEPTADEPAPDRDGTDGSATADAGAVAELPPGYPKRWEADVALSDGRTVRVRPVRPDDAELVSAFHARQASEDVYLRYFTSMPKLTPRILERLTTVDYVDHLGFVALLGDEVIAMASYDNWPERGVAEVAFMVDGAHQRRGLATVLLEYLAVAAREAGFPALVALVLPSNQRMISVFRQVGFEVRTEFDDGVIEVRLDLAPFDGATEIIEERARRAEARSVAQLLSPRSIAVIGAGRMQGGLGHAVFERLLQCGFHGPVYPVNPHVGNVASVRAWPTVLEVPDEIDVAVIAVPADATLDIVEQCGRKRVKGIIVASAGFGPPVPPGHTSGDDLAFRLVERARRWGIRVVGPESLGIISTDPGVSMFATHTAAPVRPGRVGFLTQSGTLGVAALDLAYRKGVGIASFVDVGRKLDVSANDVLQAWEQDPRTAVATLYLESFGNPRKFVRIARRMAHTTPIIAVKAGHLPVPGRPVDADAGTDLTSPGGQPGGAAELWPADATYSALLGQAGVMRVETLPELFDLARLVLHQPIPRGRSVAIISNSRGATSMAVDACAAARLSLAPVDTSAPALRDLLPAGWVVTNPVDLPFDAGPAAYRTAVHTVAGDPSVDAVVVIYAPATRDQRGAVGEAVADAAASHPDVSVVATFLGASIDEPLVAAAHRVPLFELPEDAVRVIGRLADHGEWRRLPTGEVPDPDDLGIDVAATTDLVERVLATDPEGRWLGVAELARVVELLGLPAVPTHTAETLDDTLVIAASLGFPVVLKAGGLPRLYRGEAGGVALDLRDADDVRGAWDRMVSRHGESFLPATVQGTAVGAVDVLVAAHQHPLIGGVIAMGVGGIASADPAAGRPVRVLPLTDEDAHRLVASSPVAGPLAVTDPTGATAHHLAALLQRIGAAVDAVPQLADVVANPVIAGPEGVAITDLRVRVAPSTIDDSPPVRRLG